MMQIEGVAALPRYYLRRFPGRAAKTWMPGSSPSMTNTEANGGSERRVGKGAFRAVPTILSLMMITRSLSSGAHSRDPVALRTLRAAPTADRVS
jgi:hypothetical protein